MLKIDSTYGFIYFVLGEIYQAQLDLKKSNLNYENALKFDQDEFTLIIIHETLARNYYQLKNNSKAKEHLIKAMEMSPNNSELKTLYKQIESN